MQTLERIIKPLIIKQTMEILQQACACMSFVVNSSAVTLDASDKNESIEALTKLLMAGAQPERIALMDVDVQEKPEILIELGQAIKNADSVTTLSLFGVKSPETVAKSVSIALEDNFTIDCLEVEYIEFKEESTSVIETIGKCTGITKLSLYGDKLGVCGAHCLSKALHNSLKELNVSDNGLGPLGTKELSAGLKRLVFLEKLSIQHNMLRPEGAHEIGEALKKLTSLIILNVSENNLGDEGIKALAPGLQKLKSLKKLDLYVNDFGHEGAKALAYALPKTITSLDISGNYITPASVKLIANQLLSELKDLANLSMYDNNICKNGALYLAEALIKLKKLKTVYLGDNNIGSDGIKLLLESLLISKETLTDLSLSFNEIRDAGIEEIVPALAKLKHLQVLETNGNEIGPDGAGFLAIALENLNEITVLDISDNLLGDKGGRRIAKMLEMKKTLKEVNLSRNGIGRPGVMAIMEAAKGLPLLNHLGLNGNESVDVVDNDNLE